ncbi:rossmann-fold NAD(P)(+)-binding protein [Colletotrichum tofieldiae]|nr:rossmann-fold NAD(P)(+)-binding protein [Colletotrichum tofieldiae]
MSIKTVAVVGASGLVGLRVVKALLEKGFEVTAISREILNSRIPIRSRPAFAGQDAVISAISTVAVIVPGAQDPLIDAAVAAGVKRFIPSEYGLNTRNLEGEILGDWLKAKTAAVDYLIKKTEESTNFTWTGIGTSLFFDWSITRGIYGISLENRSITIFDSGNQKVSTTSLAFLAEGIVAVLQHPVETANKYINIVEFEVTQNQLHKLFEEETGANYTVEHKTADEAEREFLQKYWFGDGPGHAIKEEDKANKVLGLPQSDLREVVRRYIKEHSA